MAFLIGDSKDARRAIITNVSQAYRLRSAFIHRGTSITELEVVRQFLLYAWQTFRALLYRVNDIDSKQSLLQELDDGKLM
jgi:hypothetical protein